MTKDILEKMNLSLEAENFELRLELEKAKADAPRFREKIEHLEKWVSHNSLDTLDSRIYFSNISLACTDTSVC